MDQGLRVQISGKQRQTKRPAWVLLHYWNPRCSDDRQGSAKLSMLWPLDSKLSSNVIPVILGHSWFSSSSQIRLRQNLLMILKAVAIPLTPILWLTLLALTLSLSKEELFHAKEKKYHLKRIWTLAYRLVGMSDTDGRCIVCRATITTLGACLSRSADKTFQNSCPLKWFSPGGVIISVATSSEVNEGSLPLIRSLLTLSKDQSHSQFQITFL